MEMNGDEYQVAINLPPPDKEIEEKKIKQYKMKIMEWGDMRYIDPDSPTFLAIWSTLVEWKDAIDENRQLQSSLKEKIDRLIEEMERPGPDKIKADRLKIRFSIPG